MFRTHIPSVSIAALVILVGIGMRSTDGKQSVKPSSRAALRLIATLSGHIKNIITESFSPDGKTIATGSEDGTVRLWDAQTGQERATLNIKSKPRTLQLEWSPDGKRLAVKHNYGGEGIQIWDLRADRLQATLGSRDDEAA